MSVNQEHWFLPTVTNIVLVCDAQHFFYICVHLLVLRRSKLHMPVMTVHILSLDTSLKKIVCVQYM